MTFCITESFKWACVKENANEMISVYDYESVVVWMVLGGVKNKTILTYMAVEQIYISCKMFFPKAELKVKP